MDQGDDAGATDARGPWSATQAEEIRMIRVRISIKVYRGSLGDMRERGKAWE